MYLFLTASQTDEEVPSQQGAPSACNLTYWEVFRQTYVIGQNSALRGKGGGGGRAKRFLTDSAQQLAPQTPTIFQFPRTYYFVQISRPAKICPKNRYFEEHINRLPLYRLIFVIVVYVIVQTEQIE